MIWYFRGTNGVPITYDIETTHLYKLAYQERAIIVCSSLVRITWSKDEHDDNDYILVHDINSRLKEYLFKGEVLNIDWNNLYAIGFCAGGGFIYRLAFRYPELYDDYSFVKFMIHAKPLEVYVNDEGQVEGKSLHVSYINRLKAIYKGKDFKPKILFSIGDTDDLFSIDEMNNTYEAYEVSGFDSQFFVEPELNHRFLFDFSEDFKTHILDYFFPIPDIQSAVITKVEKVVERSLFSNYYSNIIFWENNPINIKYEIDVKAFKIYRREKSEESYSFICEVSGDIFSYEDVLNESEKDKEYEYYVTCLDSEGNESEITNLKGGTNNEEKNKYFFNNSIIEF